MSLDTLPVELLHRLFSLLPLSSTYQLAGTCKRLHLVHKSERLWKFQVLRSHRLLLSSRDRVSQDLDDVAACPPPAGLAGLIRDPSLQGHQEMYLLYSTEFQHVAKTHRDHHGRSGELERFLRSILPKSWSPGYSFIEPEFTARLALFGPGIESPNTKPLVHKVVNSHSCLFNAIGYVPGLSGGFGSGVKILFRNTYTFDLSCLYTNSWRVRECQRGLSRLLAANNRLLGKDALVRVAGSVGEEPSELSSANGEEAAKDLANGKDGKDVDDQTEPSLHKHVLTLLPSLDAILFSVDGSELQTAAAAELAEQLTYVRSELAIMIEGLDYLDKTNAHASSTTTPILVLHCYLDDTKGDLVPVTDLAHGLGLRGIERRPWAIFNVNINSMDGMAKALDWVLYHLQKRRNNWQYHQSQSAHAGAVAK